MNVRGMHPDKLVIKCPHCDKRHSVAEWDKTGRERWSSYSSIHNAILGGSDMDMLEFKSPCCNKHMAGFTLNFEVAIQSNKEAVKLLRKEGV
jgi:hypothetical protein